MYPQRKSPATDTAPVRRGTQRARCEQSEQVDDETWKGVGKNGVFPWRKDWENRGFPRSLGGPAFIFTRQQKNRLGGFFVVIMYLPRNLRFLVHRSLLTGFTKLLELDLSLNFLLVF